MFVFYDWPLAHVYFAKNVAYFPFNSWLSFQRLCRLLWGYSYQWMHTYLTIRAIRFFRFPKVMQNTPAVIHVQKLILRITAKPADYILGLLLK